MITKFKVGLGCTLFATSLRFCRRYCGRQSHFCQVGLAHGYASFPGSGNNHSSVVG